MKILSHDVELVESLESPPGLEVWLARQVALNRLVEVITLREGVTPRSPHAQAAATEARAHSRLHHRSILEVYSFSVTDTSMVIEREAVRGTPLALGLNDFTLAERLRILSEVAEAVAHGHERRVLHGDLGLHRIVMAGQSVKLSGFGLELESYVDTCPSDAVSGLGLRAPEVRIGAPFGVLAEVYCFGCLAFEVLTGRTWDTSMKGVTAPLPRNLGLPLHVEELLNACLARVPAQRPPSMSHVAERLSPNFLAPRPSVARSIAPPRRLGAGWWVVFGLGLTSTAALGGYFATARLAREVPRLSVVPLESDASRQGARIRVVARPWAHVMVDGKFYDTTPFATPIAVEPGVHTIRLEHPEAAPEERTVQVGPGQTALVDAALKLTRPIILDREVERPVETTP